MPVQVFNLIFRRHQFGGSLIGGIRETQELPGFCGAHNRSRDLDLISRENIHVARDAGSGATRNTTSSMA